MKELNCSSYSYKFALAFPLQSLIEISFQNIIKRYGSVISVRAEFLIFCALVEVFLELSPLL